MVKIPKLKYDYYVDEEGNFYWVKKNGELAKRSFKKHGDKLLCAFRKEGVNGSIELPAADIILAAYKPEMIKKPCRIAYKDGDCTNLNINNLYTKPMVNFRPSHLSVLELFDLEHEAHEKVSEEEFETEYSKWASFINNRAAYFCETKTKEERDFRESLTQYILYQYMCSGKWALIDDKKRYLAGIVKGTSHDWWGYVYNANDKAIGELTDRNMAIARTDCYETYNAFQLEQIEEACIEDIDKSFIVKDELKKRLSAECYDVFSMLEYGYTLDEIYKKYTADFVMSAVAKARNVVLSM